MEGCGIPPKRAGQHRREMGNYTSHRIPHSGFPLWQRKKTKNYTANFTSSHHQKKSQSSNVKAADIYRKKKQKTKKQD